jgi:peptide/nickel transport system substrate-binding protein
MMRRSIAVCVLLLFAATLVMAEGGKEAPGVTPGAAAAAPAAPSKFKEAPLLAEMARRGLIPWVEERLPVAEDVLVVKPLHSQGRYGGTARTFNAEDPKRPYTSMMLMGTDGPFRATPEAKPGVPNIFKSFEHNANFTVWTFKLRKGLKWSDGVPLTAENFLLSWKLYWSNPDLVPTVRNMKITVEDKAVTFYNQYNDKRTVKKEVVDDTTLRFTSDFSYPTLINHLSHPHSGGPDYFILPMHFLKQFHPDVIGAQAAADLAKKAGFATWFQMLLFFSPIQGQQSPVQVLGNFPPSLSPYVAVSKTQTTIVWERNPYYHAVDTAGNQLPYIDKIVGELVPKKELINGKIIAGEVDFEGFSTTTPDIPLFKKYEQQGGYTAHLWNFAASASVMHPYHSSENEAFREVINIRDFRIALSRAIDRKRINEEVCFGRARPVMMTVLPNSMWFKPEYETKYGEYDPAWAKKTLDELGIRDRNGDGWREDPKGRPLAFSIEFRESEAPRIPVAELVKENWRAVGLNVEVKVLEASLDAVRAPTNKPEMRIWHGDARTEMLFPSYINTHIFPMAGVSWFQHWFSGGKVGDPGPKDVIEDIYETYTLMDRATSRDEMIRLGRKMLDNAMENVWVIGTVSDFPHPMIVKNDIMNFPTEKDGPLIYEWSTWWTNAYLPPQFYFKDRPQVKFEESGLPKIYPVDKLKDPITRAKEERWL